MIKHKLLEVKDGSLRECKDFILYLDYEEHAFEMYINKNEQKYIISGGSWIVGDGLLELSNATCDGKEIDEELEDLFPIYLNESAGNEVWYDADFDFNEYSLKVFVKKLVGLLEFGELDVEENIKKEQIIKHLKQQLQDGIEITYDEDTTIRLVKGLLCEYIDGEYERNLDIDEVADMLEEIAEQQIEKQEEFDAVAEFLNS